MDTIFMNSENSKTLKKKNLALKLTDKLELLFTRPGKIYNNTRVHTIIINLKYLLPHGMMNLSHLMDLILYQIFKIILNIFQKNIKKISINHQYKYILIKLKIGSHLKFKMDMLLNF